MVRVVVNDETHIPVVPDALEPARCWEDVQRESLEALKPENMEHLDSRGVTTGGHRLHLEGGAEAMWGLNAELLDAIKRFHADTGHFQRRISELEVLLSQPKKCRRCGESS